MWHVRPGREATMENEVDSGSNQFTTMDWSPMGANEIALGTDGSSIEIWDINQRGLKAEIMLRDEQISSLAYSPFHPSILGLLGSAGIQILDLRPSILSMMVRGSPQCSQTT